VPAANRCARRVAPPKYCGKCRARPSHPKNDIAIAADNARILGTRCGRCGVTYVPGRLFCERCFDELREWTEVGPEGTVEAVTALYLAPDGLRLAQPALLALIRLDKASTVLVHRLGDLGADDAKIGLRVEPVFKPAADRTGSILDILHFRPTRPDR